MQVYKKAILPLGFKASALACGIKKSGKLDLGLFYSSLPASAACLFTSNKISAAPLKINKKYLTKSRNFQALIVNSGNANCFTGKNGLKDAEDSAQAVAKALDIKKESVLLASTGIIARRLAVSKIKKAIPQLVSGLSSAGIDRLKRAIMTTDTFAKEISVKINIGNKAVTICGVAKGAGMIAPNMVYAERGAKATSRSATMLCFIMTDANIAQGALKKALSSCVDNSFNCITVDGCMSTNDSLMLLANGRAGNIKISGGKHYDLFLQGLNLVCLELAKMIVRDAEGGSKFISIQVDKARSLQQAKKAALAIANSNLFKTAVYGQNPNFGRIAAAVGASGIDVEEDNLKIKVSSLKKKEVKVAVSIGSGNSSAVVYTSDLTPEYVKINAEYN